MYFFRPAVTGITPSPRYNHQAVLVGTHLYVFGGYSHGKPCNDLHVLDTGTPQPISDIYRLFIDNVSRNFALVATRVLWRPSDW